MAEKVQTPINDYSKVSSEQRRILGEFYDIFSKKQWFHRTELMELHPTHMKPAIQVFCNYNPILEMKEILTFTNRYNLALEIIPRSHQG